MCTDVAYIEELLTLVRLPYIYIIIRVYTQNRFRQRNNRITNIHGKPYTYSRLDDRIERFAGSERGECTLI